MDENLSELKKELIKIKKIYEETILRGGTEGIHSLIRSQKLICIIHDYIKSELISYGVSSSIIYPPLNKTNPELSMSGFLKTKDQDICVVPGTLKEEKIKEGVLMGKIDPIGKSTMEKSISVNVRSQLSSLAKNFDTLYERTFAEALNLHLRVPKLVLGEVYLVPLIAYDPDKANEKKIAWKEKLPIKYIPAFRELTGRNSSDIDDYKYERVCLLIVDFSQKEPVIINTSKQLFEMGWIKEDEIETFSLEGLGMKDFVKDLMSAYKKRHEDAAILTSKKVRSFF